MAHSTPSVSTGSAVPGSRGAHTIPLPLHVCEVLEEEYAVLHEQPTGLPDWDFDETHFFTSTPEDLAQANRATPAAELLELIRPSSPPTRGHRGSASDETSCVNPPAVMPGSTPPLDGGRPRRVGDLASSAR
jgi:hypothetical protein